METQQRRLRVRKPLSDCTNTLNSSSQSSSSSSSFSLLKRQDPNLSSIFKGLLSDTNPKSKSTTTTTTTSKSATGNDVVPKPSSTLLSPVASTPSRPPRSSSSASDGGKVSEPCSVYTRRQTAEKRKTKGKAIAEPFTCIPALKTRKIGEKIKEDGGNNLSKACTVPHKKKQRQIPSEKDVAMHALPRDFIEQQRAYFAEIDAFELPEEEVKSVEELD